MITRKSVLSNNPNAVLLNEEYDSALVGTAFSGFENPHLKEPVAVYDADKVYDIFAEIYGKECREEEPDADDDTIAVYVDEEFPMNVALSLSDAGANRPIFISFER